MSTSDRATCHRDRSDLYSALFFLAIGAGAIAISRTYPMGTASQMGSGYFPFLLGVLMVVLGLVLLVSYQMRPATTEEDELVTIRPLFFVPLSLVMFAVLVQDAGLVVAAPAMIFIASLSEKSRRWRELTISGIVLTAFVAIVFVYGFGVTLPILPKGLG